MNKKYGRKKGVAEEKAWQPPNKETIKIHNKEAAKVSRNKKKAGDLFLAAPNA